MPSTHDQMIECDWTCAALRIRAEVSPPQAVVTGAASASQEGERSQPVRSGVALCAVPERCRPLRIGASYARSSSSTIDSTASKGARSWPSR